MNIIAAILVEKIGNVLVSAFAQAKRDVSMVAPFISRRAFDQLIDVIEPSVSVEVITRWLPSEVAQGVADPSILDFANTREHFTVRLLSPLHAKLYIVDDKVAFLGSANLTAAGLGFEQHGNIEALVELSPVPPMLLAFHRRIRREAVLATQELRDAVEKAASLQQLAPSTLTVNDERYRSAQLSRFGDMAWVPVCRFPDRLYAAYQSLESLPATTRVAALEDLSWITCPDNLSRHAFNDFVRNWLLEQPIIQELDGLVRQPKRFGELSAWLKRRLPEGCPDMKSAKRRLQTLIRWLLFFAGDKYRLSKGRYTEILSRVRSARS